VGRKRSSSSAGEAGLLAEDGRKRLRYLLEGWKEEGLGLRYLLVEKGASLASLNREHVSRAPEPSPPSLEALAALTLTPTCSCLSL
jgi:hypothetical protein